MAGQVPGERVPGAWARRDRVPGERGSALLGRSEGARARDTSRDRPRGRPAERPARGAVRRHSRRRAGRGGVRRAGRVVRRPRVRRVCPRRERLADDVLPPEPRVADPQLARPGRPRRRSPHADARAGPADDSTPGTPRRWCGLLSTGAMTPGAPRRRRGYCSKLCGVAGAWSGGCRLSRPVSPRPTRSPARRGRRARRLQRVSQRRRHPRCWRKRR